jgi:hypothetical protein
MANGRHHEFLKPVMERVSISAADICASDGKWLLAAAVLNTLADDLALTCAAGWWAEHPQEMAGKCDAADRLLRELRSPQVAGLCALVTDGTRGRIEVGWGWMIRLARGRVGTLRMTGRRLGMHAVSEALRLPSFSAGKVQKRKPEAVEIDLTGMPPVRINGKFNSAYGRERSRRLREAGVCVDCRVPLPVKWHKTRCKACGEVMAKIKADSRRRMKEVEV